MRRSVLRATRAVSCPQAIWASFTYPFPPLCSPFTPHNNELFVCGRLKDLIIIHGKNHYPQDIEYSCHAVKEVKQGSIAAFDVVGGKICDV